MTGDLTAGELDLLRQSFEWARNGDVTHMAQLLTIGAPPNLTNERGDSLLILAAYHRQEDMVRLLLEHRADVERFNDNGQTALGAAVFRQAPAIVALLLAAGADPDSGPRSARQVADFFDLPEMAALLPLDASTPPARPKEAPPRPSPGVPGPKPDAGQLLRRDRRERP